MIARHIEINLKPDRYNEFKTLYENEILPIMQRQTGFLDELALVGEGKTERHMVVTLWKTKTDVENYNKREFPKILEMVKPFLNGTPKVEYFTVEHTTFRKVESVAA